MLWTDNEAVKCISFKSFCMAADSVHWV